MTLKEIFNKHSWMVYLLGVMFLWFVHQELGNFRENFSNLEVKGVADQDSGASVDLDLEKLSILKVASKSGKELDDTDIDSAFLDPKSEPSEEAIETKDAPEIEWTSRDVLRKPRKNDQDDKEEKEALANWGPLPDTGPSKEEILQGMLKKMVHTLPVQGYTESGAWIAGDFISKGSSLEGFPLKLSSVDIKKRTLVFNYKDFTFTRQIK